MTGVQTCALPIWPLVATVDRRRWIAGRLAEIRDRGGIVLAGERFYGIEGRTAFTESSEIEFGHAVGADGAASRVRRHLGLPTGLAVCAWQLALPADGAAARRLGIDDLTVFFEPRRFAAGYGWAFPAPGELRLGAGASTATLARGRLKAAFFAWLADLGVSRADGRLEAGTIPCGYLGHRFGPLRLAGDAAGLASPVTGEGIGPALVSGVAVAEEIAGTARSAGAVAELGRRHRRTHDLLARRGVGPLLYALAPALLRLPPVAAAALGRYG